VTNRARCQAVVLLLFFSSTAYADGNEIQLTVGPGYSSIPDVGEGLDGLGGGGELGYGLSEFWSLTAGAFFGHHFEQIIEAEDDDDEDQVFVQTDVLTIWFGPRFNFDVLIVVPYFGIAPEIILTEGELQTDQSETDYGLRYTLGFDYRPERNWSLGFEANYHAFLVSPLGYPVYVTTMFRLSFHHDFDDL
jgi:opacity protein-like surface antigen